MTKGILHLADNQFGLTIPDKNINNFCGCFSNLFKQEYNPHSVQFEDGGELFMNIKDYKNDPNGIVLKITISKSGDSFEFSLNVDLNSKSNYSISTNNNNLVANTNNVSWFQNLTNAKNKQTFSLTNNKVNPMDLNKYIYIRIYSIAPNQIDPLAKIYDENTNFTLEASYNTEFKEEFVE